MAATVSTLASNLTAPVNYVLMRRLLSAARAKLPYFNGTLPGTLEKKQGAASVKWRRIENLTTSYTAPSALSEITGTATAFLGRDAVQPTITDIVVAMAKYGKAILTTEEVDLYNVNSNTVALMDTLGADAGLNLNLLMRDVYASGFTANIRIANGAATYSSAATAISLNDIKWSVNKLNRNSAMKFLPMTGGSTNIGTVPVRESYMGICHVDVEDDIRGLSGFIPVEQYGGYTETMPFEFGAVAGVRWSSTEIAPILTSGSTEAASGFRGASTLLHDVYDSFIYGMETIGSVGLGNMHAKTAYEMYDPSKPPAVEIIQHVPGSSGVFDMFNEVGSIAWKSFFAGKVLNAAWGVRVRTLSASI
jgi:N4-gp56 family major capsid protein